LKEAAMPRDDEFPHVYIEEPPLVPPMVTQVETSRTVFAGLAGDAALDKIIEFTSFAEVEAHENFSAFSKALILSLRLFFQNGGKDARVIGLSDLSNPDGLEVLADLEFNLLCIPTTFSDPDVSPELHAAAHQLCGRSRAIYLADPAPSWSAASDPVGAAIDGVRQLFAKGENAAMYFPRVNFSLNGAGAVENGFALSGAVAGFIAGNDQRRGVWNAPAGSGAALSGVASLSVPMPKAKQELLKSAGINALQKPPGGAILIWGARTVAGADRFGSEWKYLPVRRLALMIETSLARGLVWTVFEPNGERLWAMVRQTAELFLQDLWRQGAFAGSTLDQALFVQCGRNTMTQSDLDNGQLVCRIGFAPTKPAEFIILRILSMTAG
jgi:uncharacterized protein